MSGPTATSEHKPPSAFANLLSRMTKQYLDAVRNGEGGKWTVVMGNEAGDLDSLVCAIAYAWYESAVRRVPAIALTQTPRGDLHLRAENAHALELAGIHSDELLCVDDVCDTSSPFPSTSFALVDHNHLNPRFSPINSGAKVVAIIDHHADEDAHGDADTRIVTPGIGSCSSLVALFLAEKCGEEVPPELATLLLSAIVIDTNGMVPGGKAVDADRTAATFLTSRCAISSSAGLSAPSGSLHESPGIRELNVTLQTKKNAVGHLNTRDLLRRDYKEYTFAPSFARGQEVVVGLASVPLALAAFVPRDGTRFVDETKCWMEERGLSALGVLTSYRDDTKLGKSGRGKHRREQMWIVRVRSEVDAQLGRRLFEGLEASKELELKKRKWKKMGVDPDEWKRDGGPFGEGWMVGVWKQGNASATRKVTAPVVRGIVEGE